MNKPKKDLPKVIQRETKMDSLDWQASADETFIGVFQSAREPLFLVDASGIIRFWNQGCELLFGFSAGEAIGNPADFLVQGGWPRNPDRVETDAPAGIGNEQGTWFMEVRGIRKNGALFQLHLSGAEGGNRGLGLVHAREVTLGGRTEAALRKSEESRKATQKHLEYRIRFENLITTLSTHFLHVPDEKIDLEIQQALQALGEFAEVDRAYIFLFSKDHATVDNTHEWCSAGIEKQIQNLQGLPVERYPWFMKRIQALQTIFVPNVREMPVAARAERDEFEREGITSLIIVPMAHQGELQGYLGFDSVDHEENWSDDIIGLLRIVGEIFVSALERKKVDRALVEATAKYSNIFENAMEGIYQTTLDDAFLGMNPAMARIFGFANSREMKSLVKDIGKSLYADPDHRAKFMRMLLNRGRVVDFESEVYRMDGSSFWITESARVIRKADGSPDYCEGTVMDITDRKVMEAERTHAANHDSLTGLPNRNLLLERLGIALEAARSGSGRLCAVLMLDLDRFKVVNDSKGHLYGDRMLIAFARRLEVSVPAGTTLARVGGDEFCMLVEGLEEFDRAAALAEQLQEVLSMPFDLDGEDVYAAASIGIAVASGQDCSPEELLRDADTAMHRAKSAGKGRHEVFDISMHTRAVQLLTLENDLRKALERGEFRLHYQPIVSLQDSRLLGFEALIRWIHPSLGMVPPLDFIPLAEDTGQIISIGRWVLWQSCKMLAEWQKIMEGGRQFTMSVNLSGKQLQDHDLIRQVKAILHETQVEARSLKLEVTESAIMENPEKAADILKSLREIGVQLSLDDFGTGYSSLSYLHRFPFHNLKIDRSFVSKLESGDKDAEIVKVINSLAKNLGMEVVAEGIETEGQWALLNGFACAYGQGYYFSRPLEENAARKLIEAGGFMPRGPFQVLPVSKA